jgi:hypothetical protein
VVAFIEIHPALDQSLGPYYTGLSNAALIRQQNGKPRRYVLDRAYRVEVPVKVQAGGLTWLVIQPDGAGS